MVLSHFRTAKTGRCKYCNGMIAFFGVFLSHLIFGNSVNEPLNSSVPSLSSSAFLFLFVVRLRLL